MPPRRTADVLYDLFCRFLHRPGFLSNLRSLQGYDEPGIFPSSTIATRSESSSPAWNAVSTLLAREKSALLRAPCGVRRGHTDLDDRAAEITVETFNPLSRENGFAAGRRTDSSRLAEGAARGTRRAARREVG